MLPPDQTLELNCPAKLNLLLAILGKQPDGFHALRSVVAKTNFGDTLSVKWWRDGDASADELEIIGSDFVTDDNTVSHAVRLFREATGMQQGSLMARLTKRIPSAAGLGGGSSDGAAMLKGLQVLFPDLAGSVDWSSLAASIGSDCPLFMHDGPVHMEGRGERVRALEPDLRDRLCGTPVLLYKPRFSINTAEAYRRLAKAGYYQEPDIVGRMLDEWKRGGSVLPPRCNDFERLVSDWLPSLDIVLGRLRKKGLETRMSGSGSACFVLGTEKKIGSEVRAELERAWGSHYWLVPCQM